MVTETTTRSWGQKIGDSIKGVLIGILLFIASFAVLWMNAIWTNNNCLNIFI